MYPLAESSLCKYDYFFWLCDGTLELSDLVRRLLLSESLELVDLHDDIIAGFRITSRSLLMWSFTSAQIWSDGHSVLCSNSCRT